MTSNSFCAQFVASKIICALSAVLILSAAFIFCATLTLAQTFASNPASASQQPAPSHTNGSATSYPNGSTTTQLTDTEFSKTLAQSLLTQIKISEIAVAEAQSDKVREYAGWLVKDYGAAMMQLRGLASKTNSTLPIELDAEHKRIVESFRQKSAQQSDNSYLEWVKEQHDNLIAICNRAHGESSVAVELRDFSDNLLPTLEQYRKRAEKLLQMVPTLS